MCLDVEPERYLANSNMANCLCKLQRYEEAVPFLQKAISRDDDLVHPDAGPLCLYNYANILNMKQEYKESVVYGGQLIERMENDDINRIHNVSKCAVYILMATNLRELQQLNEALEYAQKAVNIEADNVSVLKLVGLIEQDLNEISL
eukprot:UN08000